MEKLKTGIMAYALKEMLNHPSQLLEDNVNQKDVQEAIYQLEDMLNGKTFLKNKSKNNKYVDNNVHIRLRDIVDLIKMKLRLAEYVDFNSEPIVVLTSKSGQKINTKVSINYPSPYEDKSLDKQRTYASSYLIISLIKMLLPYVSKADFDDTTDYFQMEILRRKELEKKKEELINEAEV
tara:strand:- start:71 stop:607 length:537 start_codon:yes stop_codon:yes gene_type:complete